MKTVSLAQFARSLSSNSLSAMAQSVGLTNRPVSARDVVRRAARPKQPTRANVTFEENGTNSSHEPPVTKMPITNLVFNCADPGAGSLAAAEWQLSELIEAASGKVVDSANFVPSLTTIFFSPPRFLYYGATEYIWRITGFNSYWGANPGEIYEGTLRTLASAPPSPGPKPPPHPPVPQPGPGLLHASKLEFYNFSLNDYTVHFWTKDLSTGDLKDQGSLDVQPNDPNPSKLDITLEDGHSYDWWVMAIVPGDDICGSAVDPFADGGGNCVFWSGGVTGDKNARPVSLRFNGSPAIVVL